MSEFTRTTAQMWLQNSLAEVVQKLRKSTSQSEEEAIEQFLADTKAEVASATQSLKVTAVQKATYFHMLGYSAAYAAFNIVEVMADPIFSHKRVGYVAACTTFLEETTVIPLITAMLRRDLCSINQYEAGMALYCISSICTPDLAKDIVSDVVKLLNHPRTYVRKKAVLSLYKIFLQYPESLRPAYPRLKDKLDDNSEQCDADPAVRGAVVCVLCELARRNPANFLGLAVPFYSLLSSVQSNWTLIKIVKVFGYFAPVEPRLGKKLVEPLTNLILSTGAKSVQYECLLAVANGMSKVPALTKLAAERLRGFVEDPDQNLKFLGLEAMSRMVGENPKLLMDQRDTVLRCLKDNDVTIRSKALEVLRDLATKKNIVSTVDAMLDHCIHEPADEAWSNAVIARIVETAQTDDYGLIDDFEWYMDVLLEMGGKAITEFKHGDLIEGEIITILMRVNGARQFAVESLSALLGNSKLLRCPHERSTQWKVLRAAAFACGEYPYWLTNKKDTCSLLLAEDISLLPAEVQVVCATAVGKIAAYVHRPCARHLELVNGEEELAPASEPDTTSYDDIRKLVASEGSKARGTHADAQQGEDATNRQWKGLLSLAESVFPEVQERARLVLHQITEAPDVGPLFYEKPLLPIVEGAQEMLEAPAGLQLDQPFCTNVAALMALSESENSSATDGDSSGDEGNAGFDFAYRIERQRRMEKSRREEMSPFYLRDNEGGMGNGNGNGDGAADHHSHEPDDVNHPERSLTSSFSPSSSAKVLPGSRLRAQRRHSDGNKAKAHGISRDLAHPATYTGPTTTTTTGSRGKGGRRMRSPEEDEATKKLRSIDVTRSLGVDEKLPEAVPYMALLQQVSHKGAAGVSVDDGRYRPAAASESVSMLPPVTLFEEKLFLRVVLHADGCKVKKDGTHLRFTLELTNLAVASALHEVRLSAVANDTYPEGTLALLAGSGSESGSREEDSALHKPKHKTSHNEADTDAGVVDAGRHGLVIAEKVKGGMTVRKPFTLLLPPSLPETLLPPVPLALDYLKEKRRASTAMALQLRYGHFAKRVSTHLSATEFNTTVLSSALAEAPVFSAFVPCSKTAMLSCAPLIQRDLQLTPMDIFKTAATFYGLIHERKSRGEQSHVAVLLRESKEEGARGLGISARTHAMCLAELLIHDIASIAQDTLGSEEAGR